MWWELPGLPQQDAAVGPSGEAAAGGGEVCASTPEEDNDCPMLLLHIEC
jgi:hypothetical protein